MITLIFTLGLLLGFLVGIAFRDALDLYRASRKDRSMACRAFGRRNLVVLFVISLLLNTIVGGLLIVTRKSAEDYSTCTASWQQQFGEAYRARVAAAVAVDQALDDVVRAVALDDRAGFRRAVAAYINLRDNQMRERRRNPLPPLPETLCGKPQEVRR